MKIKYTPRAEQDLDQFSDKVEKEVRDKIDELEDKPTNHEDSKMFPLDGREIFSLSIGERGEEVNHRSIYDIKNGEIVIITVINRDDGYEVVSL